MPRVVLQDGLISDPYPENLRYSFLRIARLDLVVVFLGVTLFAFSVGLSLANIGIFPIGKTGRDVEKIRKPLMQFEGISVTLSLGQGYCFRGADRRRPSAKAPGEDRCIR